MSGIVFLKTTNMEAVRNFYVDRIEMEVWLEQAECVIFKHGNLLLGFCSGKKSDIEGCFTFFYPQTKDVDEKYETFSDCAVGKPERNERYNIYNFFAKDPEGRTVEFQSFLHHLEPFLDATELLLSRRSIRRFATDIPSDAILEKIIDNCRFAPTARNSQPFYFRTIKDRSLIQYLSQVRGGATAPIANAPVAMAICSDPEISSRYIQDGCIGAYHFCLASWAYGLGTCWMADMDRDDLKNKLGIPLKHYVATVTPVGYPAEIPAVPSRKNINAYIR